MRGLLPEDKDAIVSLAEVWMVTDRERCFLEMSPRLLRALGYEREEVLGQHYSKFIHEGDLSRARKVGDQLTEKKTVDSVVVRYRKKTGGFLWLEFSCIATPDASRRICVGRDITQRKLLEATNAANRAALREQATKDFLTGALNRRMFDEHLHREMARSLRHLRPLSLVTMDIDHFKKLNDSYGHDAGDAALKAVAERLRGTSRVEDLVFRCGGEEFAMLLVECSADRACLRAEAALADVRGLTIVYADSRLPTITLSAGIATYPDHARTDAEMVRAADVALYASKAGGRNRVSLAEVPRMAGGVA